MTIIVAAGLALVLAVALRPRAPAVTVHVPENGASEQPVPPKAEIEKQAAPPEPAPAVEPVSASASAPAATVDRQTPRPVPPSALPKVPTSALAVTPNAPQPVRRGKPPIQDPGAREALHLVGADPRAEKYWLRAINDPALPAQERQDLIEDLNETGLQDPQHPTDADLPVIVSRLRLIEAEADHAMDEVNADAFAEAYKDLKNLFDVAAGKREPPR